MKKLLRSIQTYFPGLHDLWFNIQFKLLRLFKKPHEEDFNAIRHFAPGKDDVFVDIETNRGEFLLSTDILHGNKNKIVGFEPNTHVFNRANKAVGYKPHIKVHNVGLSNQDGQLELYVPFYRKWMFDGLSSFDYSSAHDWLEN